MRSQDNWPLLITSYLMSNNEPNQQEHDYGDMKWCLQEW
jgi:hypothetical protein